MVTLKVTNRIDENTAVLNEHEWALVKQAKYHHDEMRRLVEQVVLKNSNFNRNNKAWNEAHQAVIDYVFTDFPTEIIYDAGKGLIG